MTCSPQQSVLAVLIGLFLSAALRFAWWIVIMELPRGTADFVIRFVDAWPFLLFLGDVCLVVLLLSDPLSSISRLAFLSYAITFMLLLFAWIEAVHSKASTLFFFVAARAFSHACSNSHMHRASCLCPCVSSLTTNNKGDGVYWAPDKRRSLRDCAFSIPLPRTSFFQPSSGPL